MSDDNQGASGNRWEPTETPTTETASQPDADPAPQTTEVPVAQAAAAEPTERTPWLTRARTTVAGAAAAVLLVGGVGGFAIGRATAGTGDDAGRSGQQGVPTGFDGDGDGPGPGGSGFGTGEGTLPDGQVPGRPGQDDGLDGQQGSQQGDTDGTDSSST